MRCYQRKAYWDMTFKAEYYVWCALRGHYLPGHDPVSGMKHSGLQDRQEAKHAYLAMARYQLRQAKQYREQNPGL